MKKCFITSGPGVVCSLCVLVAARWWRVGGGGGGGGRGEAFCCGRRSCPTSILYTSIAGRYRPVSYPDGPITARYIFIKNAYWVIALFSFGLWAVYCLSLFVYSSSCCHWQAIFCDCCSSRTSSILLSKF